MNQAASYLREQRAFFASGVTRRLPFRLTMLRRLYRLLSAPQSKKALLAALLADLGKERREAAHRPRALVLLRPEGGLGGQGHGPSSRQVQGQVRGLGQGPRRRELQEGQGHGQVRGGRPACGRFTNGDRVRRLDPRV